jgi:co-chaperonin GroES (HSP10)
VNDVQLSVRGSRVLVRTEDQTEYTTDHGVVVVKSYDPKTIGIVEACGHDVTEVEVGDVVLFSPVAGREVEWNGQQYLVMDEDEILMTWYGDLEPV